MHKPHERIRGAAREELAAELVEAYRGGVSIRALATECGWSYGSVHTFLVEGGALLRQRGGAYRKPDRPISGEAAA